MRHAARAHTAATLRAGQRPSLNKSLNMNQSLWCSGSAVGAARRRVFVQNLKGYRQARFGCNNQTGILMIEKIVDPREIDVRRTPPRRVRMLQ